MRRYLGAGAALCVGLSLLGCRKSAPLQEEGPGEIPREVDPPELGARGASDCHPLLERALTILPASGERIEPGGGISVPGGFALSTLAQTAAGSEARLFVRVGEGTRDVAVGRIYGGGEPPKIAALGGTVFLAWVDADAGGRTARLGAVTTSGQALSIRKVIELNTSLRPLDGIELQASEGRVAIVWDSAGPSSVGPSGIYCALYDPATLAATGAPRRVSPRADDASRPILVPRPGGSWLLWIATLKRPKEGADPGLGLVDAPPERLRILGLGPDCAPLGEPLDLGEPGRNIEFDAVDRTGSLFVISKDDRALNYDLRVVQLSGTALEKGPLEPSDLELPRLLVNRDAPWILGRAKDGAALLGRLQVEGPSPLRPEPSLLGAEVLGAVEEGLIVERSRGPEQQGSVLIDVISCGTGAAGPK